MATDALQKAVDLAGGQLPLAKMIGVRQGDVWKWLNRAKREVPPAEYAIPIERAVGGQVTRHELRPDIYPIEDAAPLLGSADIQQRDPDAVGCP